MTRTPLRSIAVAVAMMFLFAPTWAAAGPKAPTTGNEPKPTGRGTGTGAVKPSDPAPSRGAPKIGNQAKGVVNGFTTTKEDSASEDDTLIGTLKIQPMEKGAKLLNLRVHRDATYKFGETKLDPEMAIELLWKGLFVSVTFDAEQNDKKKAVPHRALKALAIDAIELEGTVVEMGQDYVVLKAKPIKGDWPDAEPPKTGGTAPLVKSAKPRELKLKSLEKVTRYLNQDLRVTEPEEFTVGQKIEAAAGIGKGKTQGLLLNLHPPLNLQTTKPKPTPRPRPPPGKATKPGG